MFKPQSRIVLFLCGFFAAFFVYKLHFQSLAESKKYKIIPLKSKHAVEVVKTNKSLLYDETLADVLFQKVRIVCLVITMPDNHKTRSKYIKNLWGKRCNKLVFFSTKYDPYLDTVDLHLNETRASLWEKTGIALQYAYKKHLNDGDFFMKVDDDSYIFMENLRYMLFQYNPEDPLYFGHRFTLKDEPNGYMAGEFENFNVYRSED
jgi:glycoprotein-N-acetylgalactosamine 3-beta-galactosyltransferase